MYTINKNVEGLFRETEKEENRFGFYKMDKNERTIPFEDRFLECVKKGLTSEILTNYPSLDSFYNKLSQYLTIDTECIFAHTGSDLAIKSIFEVFANCNTKIMMHKPSYGMYDVYSNLFSTTERCIQKYDDELNFDFDEYKKTIQIELPDIVIIENPNGFIGNYYKHDEIKDLVKTAKANNSLVIVDEAYIDFADESVIDLIPDYNNLIIVRTMSKAWGIAGLRLGYIISQKENIDAIKKVRPMHELTSFTAYVGEMLLDNKDIVDAYVEETAKARDYFISEMNLRGIRTSKCKTNFVTTELGKVINIDDFRGFLKDRKYLIRNSFREENLKNWVRIGLLTVGQMEGFVGLLDEFISMQWERY